MTAVSSWKKIFGTAAVLLVAGGFLPAPTSAHIVNSDNVYEDVRYSSAKEQIVLLTGLNVIVFDHHETMFRPQEYLERKDLARWAAVFRGIAESGQDAESAGQATLEQGWVDSLAGNATYGEVNRAFFDGRAEMPPGVSANDELTREQFAAWLGSIAHVSYHPQGNLFERSGLTQGPSGETVQSAHASEEHGVHVTVGNQDYMLSDHPRILHAPTDPSLWEGLTLAESWLKDSKLHILVFADASPQESSSGSETAAVAVEEPEKSEEKPLPKGSLFGRAATWMIAVGVLVCLVGLKRLQMGKQ